jgi:hypothetical protein
MLIGVHSASTYCVTVSLTSFLCRAAVIEQEHETDTSSVTTIPRQPVASGIRSFFGGPLPP